MIMSSAILGHFCGGQGEVAALHWPLGHSTTQTYLYTKRDPVIPLSQRGDEHSVSTMVKALEIQMTIFTAGRNFNSKNDL